MPKLEHWTDTVPLIVLMFTAFLAGCLTATQFSDIEWETLTAGFLGLTGGYFALLASKHQIRAQEKIHQEKITTESIQTNFRYYTHTVEIADLAREYGLATLQTIKKLRLNAEILKTFKESLEEIEVLSPPLTADNEISQTAIGLRVIKSKILTFLVTAERRVRDTNTKNKDEDWNALLPATFLEQLKLFTYYGEHLRDITQTKLDQF
ncbi:hypothetical protein [Thalassospira lucentensis]|uniref:hypothetical protein n=1 Tax=Thalassospira lucentensis TaxID=168935 RepID=UPI003AA7CD5D